MSTYDPENDRPAVMSPTGHMTPDSSLAWRLAWFRATVRRLGCALEGVQPERAAVALSTRVVVIVLACLLSACGGSSSPTAPTPMVSTPAPVAAPPAARLVVAEPITYTSCVDGLCSFRSRIRNDGDTCATNISGESWIMSAQGQEVGRARWSIEPSVVLRPGESVAYRGVGMPQIVLNHLDGRYFASFVFESRQC